MTCGETPSLAMPLAAVRRKLDESRPLFAFAGIWRLWTGERRGKTGEHSMFAFLTTQSNDIVRPIHAKAMPVLLTTEQDFDTWLDAPYCKGRSRTACCGSWQTGEKADGALVED